MACESVWDLTENLADSHLRGPEGTSTHGNDIFRGATCVAESGRRSILGAVTDLQIEILENSWHLASTVGLVLLGILIAIRLGKLFSLPTARALLLYVWHTVFCLIYLAYVFEDGGDALMYYQASLSSELVFSLGTRAVVFITAIFSSGLVLSVLCVFLVYNIFGYV